MEQSKASSTIRTDGPFPGENHEQNSQHLPGKFWMHLSLQVFFFLRGEIFMKLFVWRLAAIQFLQRQAAYLVPVEREDVLLVEIVPTIQWCLFSKGNQRSWANVLKTFNSTEWLHICLICLHIHTAERRKWGKTYAHFHSNERETVSTLEKDHLCSSM